WHDPCRTLVYMLVCVVIFFFQAEDGIRDFHVTGVQTCALPISASPRRAVARAVQSHPCGTRTRPPMEQRHPMHSPARPTPRQRRSEERRVGKECRARWTPEHEKKKQTKERRGTARKKSESQIAQ